MSRVLFDLEGNGFLAEISRVHCIATCDVDTEERRVFGPEKIRDALDYLAGNTLIAHNGLGYDYPVLDKLYGFKVPVERQLDTLVLARLIHPAVGENDKLVSIKRIKAGGEGMGAETGKHSLRAWGKRLQIPKADFDGPWDGWTQQMQDYCEQDVSTNFRLWRYLDVDRYSKDAIELEHDVARLCHRLTAAGWPFDEKKAGELHVELTGRKAKLEASLVAEFKGWEEVEIFVPKVNNKSRGYVKGVPFEKKSFLPFKPSNRNHIVRALMDRGWEPEEFTDNGKPKLDDEIIESLVATFKGCEGLTEYLMICKRLGQLATGPQAWMGRVKGGRIHSDYNPMGTVTSRASHYNPNIAQVPTVSSPYGEECRQLFTVPAGYVQLGADMAGLELRCFAHYLAKHDGGNYGKLLLTGDPHWEVALALGLVAPGTRRDKNDPLHTLVREQGAKRGMYAMLYGCGDEKMGRIVCDVARAARKLGHPALFEQFFGANEAPNKKLLRAVGAAAKAGVIAGIAGFKQLKGDITKILDARATLPGLDKRRLPVRSEHAALNVLLQSAGAILCKRWIVDADWALRGEYAWGVDYWFLGWIHDELQIAVRAGLETGVGGIVVNAARRAGERYGFRIALDSDYQVGSSWAECH